MGNKNWSNQYICVAKQQAYSGLKQQLRSKMHGGEIYHTRQTFQPSAMDMLLILAQKVAFTLYLMQHKFHHSLVCKELSEVLEYLWPGWKVGYLCADCYETDQIFAQQKYI